MALNPPLQLKDSYYKNLSLNFNDDVFLALSEAEEGEVELKVSINIDLNVKRSKKDPSNFLAELNIETAEGNNHPIEFNLTLAGFFIVELEETEDEAEPEDKAKNDAHYFKLVRLNGGSILYSSAREYLRLIASRFPMPEGFQLPTVSPRDAFLTSKGKAKNT